MSLINRNTLAAVSATALTTSYGAFATPERDDRTIIVIVATAACTVTVKGGNSVQAAGDLSLSITAAGTYLMKLDSGRYKMVSGENKGKVLIKASADSKASAAVVSIL